MASVEVRDALHGLIDLSPDEWKVVNTDAFQRLRGIQQLAMTHLIYPGARHSRFEHCMGACHVAGRLATSLGRDPEEVRRLRLSGLLHDLGHGPFSHVSEEVFGINTGREDVHESISAAFVRHHPALSAAVAEDGQWIAELLSSSGHGSRRSFERDLIAGPADVDKLDYLLRDSRFCGVAYGEYDLDKVIESARVVTDIGERTSLGFDESGVFALEEMLLARYHMHMQVYGHKTRIASDRMLVKALMLFFEDGVLPREIWSPPEDPDEAFLAEYARWDDARVIKTLLDRPETRAGEVMHAIQSRRLLKRAVRFGEGDLIDAFDRVTAGYILRPQQAVLQDRLPEAEQAIGDALGIAPYWVAVRFEHRASPISARADFRIFDSDIIILSEGGSIGTFHEVSEVFQQAQIAGRESVSIYVLPSQAEGLSRDEIQRASEAALEALRNIGQASAAIEGG